MNNYPVRIKASIGDCGNFITFMKIDEVTAKTLAEMISHLKLGPFGYDHGRDRHYAAQLRDMMNGDLSRLTFVKLILFF